VASAPGADRGKAGRVWLRRLRFGESGHSA
jgi:hypothetical protein